MYGLIAMVIVATALWAVRRTPALTWVAVMLGGPAMVFTVVEAVFPTSAPIVICSSVLHAALYFYVSYGMLRYVFTDDRVTRDELFAIVAAFTVVAWGFGYAYAGLQAAWPGSFGDERTWFELLFLSFTSLASVGLSDIVPVSPHGRSLVIIEEVCGVMYVAVVVARLVALSTNRNRT